MMEFSLKFVHERQQIECHQIELVVRTVVIQNKVLLFQFPSRLAIALVSRSVINRVVVS